MEVQTRSETNGMRQFDTVKEAFDHANEDLTVWKVSFTVTHGEECSETYEEARFVRCPIGGDAWMFKSMT